jgi:hypothetical protein
MLVLLPNGVVILEDFSPQDLARSGAPLGQHAYRLRARSLANSGCPRQSPPSLLQSRLLFIIRFAERE